MVLHPLEFAECFLDSPWFRQSVKEHEDELERTNSQIKLLIKDAKAMLQACRKQGDMMQAFSDRLKKFQFEIIGDNLTDAEKGIAGSLKEFGSMLEEIESEWTRTIERSELQLIEPLEKFRKDHIHSYREAKKSFDKSSDRYYKQMEQALGLSHKKKEHQLLDSDNELSQQKKNFHKVSLNYVYKLQEVQERKKFEFVEHLLMFMQVYFNFFRQTHETAVDCKEYMNEIQMRLVRTRSQYEGARDKTQMLMRKMMDNPSSCRDGHSGNQSPQRVVGQRWARAGYLYLLEKNALGSRFTSKWTRYFCMYTKENRLFQMLPLFTQSSSSGSNAVARIGSSNHHGSLAIATDPLIVLSCVRRATDSIDRRFCFDIEVEDSAAKQSQLTLQATSLNDRKKWIAAMDGKEPDYPLTEYKKPEEFELNENSIKFVEDVIEEIERRGIDAEGIYRLVGVSSKVDKLLQIVMEPSMHSNLNYQDTIEWELNTLTSALKNFFRNLPEPIMTFDLHEDFIAAAKQENPDQRLDRVIGLVSKLSEDNKLVLEMLIKHLKKVASKWEVNKMTVQNIGVCFGPTLMRPKQETVQSIMEIKFNNIIVEILIENYAAIFGHADPVEEKKPASSKLIDSRPSIRFKSKMRSTPSRKAALRSSARNMDDKGQSTETSSRFQRGHAFRGIPGNSPSSRSHQREEGSKVEDCEDSLSSDSNPDDFGRMSPLDLNLNLDHFSAYTNLQPKTNPVPKDERVQKEEWSIERRQGRRTVLQRPKSFQRDPRNIQSQRASSPPNFNLNHNNSACHAEEKVSTSYKELSKQSLESSHGQVPADSAIGLAVATRESPLQINNRNHGQRIESAEGVLNFKKLQEKFSRGEEASNSNAMLQKSGRTGEQSQSFLPWPKPGIHEPTNYSEGNALTESRPRSTVVFSRDDCVKASPTNLTSPCGPPIQRVTLTSSQHGDVLRGNVYIALFECEAEHETELSFKKGSVIHNVRPSDEPGWLVGTLGQTTGLIPENYVRQKV